MGIGFAEGRFTTSHFRTDLGLIRFTDLLVCVALGIDMVCYFHNLLSFDFQLSVSPRPIVCSQHALPGLESLSHIQDP